MTDLESAIEAARRCGIPCIAISDSAPDGYLQGPGVASLHPDLGVCWEINLNNEQEGLHLLHEIAHLLFWRFGYGVDIPEYEGMLQWEHAVIRCLGGRQAARDYMNADYTQNTTVIDDCELLFWERPRATRWWRDGVTLAIEVGLLYKNGNPRFPKRWGYQLEG